MGGLDQIVLYAYLCEDVRMENVSISQILVNVMMVGKDIYVMNQVASKFYHYKFHNNYQEG